MLLDHSRRRTSNGKRKKVRLASQLMLMVSICSVCAEVTLTADVRLMMEGSSTVQK